MKRGPMKRAESASHVMVELSELNAENQKSFYRMFFLTGGYCLLEFIVGIMSGSLALVSDAFHMLSDFLALLVGFYAVKWSIMETNDPTMTYGYARAEVLGANINATALLAICFMITIESIQRFFAADEHHVESVQLVLWVGSVGLLINLLGLCIFGGHGHSHGGGHGHSHGGHGHSHGKKEKKKGHGHSHGHGDGKPCSGHGHEDPTKKDSSHGHSHGGHGHSHGGKPCSGHGHKDGGKKDSGYGHSHTGHGHSHASQDQNDSKIAGATSLVDDHGEIGRLNRAGSVASMTSMFEEPENMNMRGVWLHILGDALGSVAVIISAAIMEYTDWEYRFLADPVCSLMIVIIIITHTWPLFKDTTLILSQRSHIDVDDVQLELEGHEDIVNVHEFHGWNLVGETNIGSIHVTLDGKRFPEESKMMDRIVDIQNYVKRTLHEAGCHSSAVQFEFGSVDDPACVDILCEGDEQECVKNQCCISKVAVQE